MADIYKGPYSGVTDVTEVVSAAAQTQILARIDLVKALLPDVNQAKSASSPDFDRIDPELSVRFRAELDALKAAIDAAPTA